MRDGLRIVEVDDPENTRPSRLWSKMNGPFGDGIMLQLAWRIGLFGVISMGAVGPTRADHVEFSATTGDHATGCDHVIPVSYANSQCPEIVSPYCATHEWGPGSRSRRKVRHRGVDIRGRHGSPIIAVADGVIQLYRERLDYGKALYVYHGKDWKDRHVYSYYGHINEAVVDSGEVKRGQKIATMGSTGTTRTHLHFQVRVGPSNIPPSSFILWTQIIDPGVYWYPAQPDRKQPRRANLHGFESGKDYGNEIAFTYPVPCGSAATTSSPTYQGTQSVNPRCKRLHGESSRTLREMLGCPD